MNLVGYDSEISDDDDIVCHGAYATQKKEGCLEPKHGLISPVWKSGNFLGQPSREEVVTSLAGEEDINTSDEDTSLGSYQVPVKGRVEKSLEVSCFGSGRQDEDAIWYDINQEAEELFQSTTHASYRCSRKANIGKRRSSASLHSHASDKEKSCLQGHKGTANSVVIGLESFQQENKPLLDVSETSVDIIPFECHYPENSAVELLDNIQRKSLLLEDGPNEYARYKRRRILSENRSLYTLGDRTYNNEDPSEPICSTPSSDDDESGTSFAAEAPEKTMADRFQEAVGTSILNDQGMQYAFSKPLGLGLSVKLQQVMRNEKDKDAHFLMIQQSIEQTHEESSFLDVKILSRYLEGKLVVCRCTVTDQRVDLHELDIFETVLENKYSERVFMFNFRCCNDVDLDVGNYVRIHSPWKEVGTARHGIVTLCSYFSQIKYLEG